MIVCQCRGTTDVAVRKAIRKGATTIGEIGFLCGAGIDCGGCHETLEAMLREEREKARKQKGGDGSAQP